METMRARYWEIATANGFIPMGAAGLALGFSDTKRAAT